MLASNRQVQSPNIYIRKLIIRSNSPGLANNPRLVEGIDTVENNLEIDLINRNSSIETLSFYSLNFIEDINQPHVSGTILLVDSTNIFDHLGISTTGEIEIQLEFNDTGKDFNDVKVKQTTLFFYIIDIDVINDPASQEISRGMGTQNYISIRFASKEFVHSDFITANYSKKNTQYVENFIGPISNEYTQISEIKTTPLTPELEITSVKAPRDPEDTDGDTDIPLLDEFGEPQYNLYNKWKENTPSFFGNLISNYNEERSISENRPKKEFKSHATHNDVWIKPEYFYYPGYKLSHTPRVTQFINYVKQFACLKEDPNYVDFMFWEDLDGFNFKSISKMAREEQEKESVYQFWPSARTNDMETIISMEIIKDTDPMELVALGGLVSEYVRVKPNWRNPFRNVLVGADRFTKKLVKYTYKDDFFLYNNFKTGQDVIITNKRMENTKGYSPFSSKDYNITDKNGDFNSNAFRISEEIYGFYDRTTHNSYSSPWWEFLDSGTRGFTWSGFTASYDGGEVGLTYDFRNHNRLEEEYWQSQYDFCELPGAGAYLIYNDIKWKLTDKREEYIQAKKHNEQWKFYLDNICCERKIPLNFFALLTDAKKIYGGDGVTFEKDPGGIYAYDWMEVEFWPRESAEAILQNGEEIIKFEGHESYPFVFVKPKGGLEGHGSINKKYKPKTDWKDAVPDVIQRKNEVYETKDTRAFNINEILNTVGITLNPFDIANVDPTIENAINECKVLITNPGVSIPFDRTKENCKTSYPLGYSMMPVGSFRYLGDCASKEKQWNFGRIVQMHVIPREIMQTIAKGEQGLTGITMYDSPNGQNEQYTTVAPGSDKEIQMGKIKNKKNIPYLFLFDVVNAHDGLCDNTCVI
jgi:hypothetical protein